jgi:putative transposase
MRKNRFTEAQIIGMIKEQEAGLPTAELCQKHGLSPATFYKWKAKYGGMDLSDAKRLKQLEDDRAAAKEAFNGFIADRQLTADQLEFLDRIIDALSETGFVDPKNFYESLYTDIASQGIVGVFPKEQAKQIIEIVSGLNVVTAA